MKFKQNSSNKIENKIQTKLKKSSNQIDNKILTKVQTKLKIKFKQKPHVGCVRLNRSWALVDLTHLTSRH
jgi:hypothetical protein